MSSKVIVSDPGIVCLVGGARLDPAEISRISSFVSRYIAVDGGADHLLGAGITPAAVIGDLDSLSEHARATFADQLCHIPEQATTDFEKALTRVSAPAVIALGFTGGRIDHALNVLNVMARYPARNVLLADADDVSFLARQGRTLLRLPMATRVSLMPLDAASVSVTGVQWPFADQKMTPTGFTSPSNAVAGDEVVIDAAGPLLITLPRAHLPAALKAVVPAG